eukprot:c18984_g1_i2 orf=173-2383(-)
MNTSGFVTSLITSFIIFFGLVLVFTWLSRWPANSVIYYSSRILNGLGLPLKTERRSPVAWIVEAWQATEEDIVALAGIDAAVYIIFLNSAVSILLYIAIFCLPVLVPLGATDTYYDDEAASSSGASNQSSSPTFTNFDKLSMGNIRQGSDRLWAFVIGAYWMSLVTYLILWKTYKHVVKLRSQSNSAPKAKPEHFAVLVRDIPPPKNGTIEEEVDAYFRKLHPDTYERCRVVTDISEVSKVWIELEKSKRKLAHAEAVFAESKTNAKPEGERPQHRTGTLGLIGPKVDSIDYLSERIKDLTVKLEKEQTRTWEEKQQGAAFVFFNSRGAATAASQVMHGEYAHSWTVMPAPEPREVVWGNLAIPLFHRMLREFAVYAIVFLTVCFYMIPISFISALISLDNLEKKLKFLKPVIRQKFVNTILQAYLPQIALIVFLAILPMLLMKLSIAEGIPSQSHAVRAAAGKFFYFNVFNVFLGVTIAGTLFNSLEKLIKSPTSIVSLLSQSLPPQATFFITFVALRFFVGYGMELLRLVPLVMFHIKRRFLCKTEEEIKEAWAPSPISYATTVPGDILILTITFCYAIIAPMILPFAIVYFALGWLVMRNQVLKVYVPAFESGGRMWPHIHSRILAALFVSQLTMLGYFSVKKFKATAFMIPLPIATLLFAYICRKFLYPSFRFQPLSVAFNEVKELPSVAAIVEAYTPTCLLPQDRFEDAEKFEDARSNLSSRTSSGITSPA